MAEAEGNMAEMVVVYDQKEYLVQAALEPDNCVSIELLQCQLLSLVGLLPEEQVLVTSRGEVIASPHQDHFVQSLPLTPAQSRERLFLVNASRAAAANDRVPQDWREVCTRCTFGDLPVVQPGYRRIGAGDTDDLVCGACATMCGTDYEIVTPLEWRASKKLADRFVSEVRVITGEASVPTPAGFTKVPGDLNYSGSGDFVHLFIKRGGTRAVTTVVISSTKPQSSKSPRSTIVQVDYNRGGERDARFFFSYDTVHLSDNESMNSFGITDFRICIGDENVPPGYIRTGNTLSEASDSTCLQPAYLYYKLAPLGGFSCVATHGAFGECLFLSRHNISEPDCVVAAGFSPVSDSVLCSFDESRQRSDNAYLEEHYRQRKERMKNQLQSGINRVRIYEDPSVQAEALKRIPVQTLHERAKSNPSPLPSYQDELVMQLTHWFKREFFTWMNQPNCSVCSYEKTQIAWTDPPTSHEEKAGDASRVEVYQCPQCQGLTRFPRYNDPMKLLDTRTGRCGEWANCFTLCCRAMGFEARYVLDVTDHVWTEVYSDHEKRWLHCDSCEDQLDCPLTYEVGWGKKLSYIFSFSQEEVVDTARRYTQNWEDMMLRRTEVSEAWLASTIESLNYTLRGSISSDRAQVLSMREKLEQAELLAGRKATEKEVQGRVSGSDEWKSQRQEDGKSEGDVGEGRPSDHHRSMSNATPSKAEVAQILLKNMVLGCDRKDTCNNPRCMGMRSRLHPQASPTDLAAEALQKAAAIQQIGVSSHGLASLTCPHEDELRDFVLGCNPLLYYPMQDSKNNGEPTVLVDASVNGRHIHGDVPRRKPFRIATPDGREEMASGVQLLPGCPVKLETDDVGLSGTIALSWMMRIDSFVFHGRRPVFELQFGEGLDALRVSYIEEQTGLYRVVLQNEMSTVTSTTTLHDASYYHVLVRVQSDQVAVIINAKNVIIADLTKTVMPRSIIFDQKDSHTTPTSAAVISHVALFTGDTDFQQVCDSMKQRYVCCAPLQAFDVSGPRPDKSCDVNEARLQSGFRVARVRMWGGEFFDGVQLVYEKQQPNGERILVDGPLVGNGKARNLASAPTNEVTLLPDEFLVTATGRKGAWTDCLRLETSFGRKFACGGHGGGEFVVRAPPAAGTVQIRAISFDVGDHLVDPVVFVAEAMDFTLNEAYIQLRALCEGVELATRDKAINAACRYLENIANAPHDPKYQKIRSSNKFFTSSIGALDDDKRTRFMQWCSFEPSHDCGETFFIFQCDQHSNDMIAAIAAKHVFFLKKITANTQSN